MTIIDQFNEMTAAMDEWAAQSRKAVMAAVTAEGAREYAHKKIVEFLETLAHPERTADEIFNKVKEKLHL